MVAAAAAMGPQFRLLTAPALRRKKHLLFCLLFCHLCFSVTNSLRPIGDKGRWTRRFAWYEEKKYRRSERFFSSFFFHPALGEYFDRRTVPLTASLCYWRRFRYRYSANTPCPAVHRRRCFPTFSFSVECGIFGTEVWKKKENTNLQKLLYIRKTTSCSYWNRLYPKCFIRCCEYKRVIYSKRGTGVTTFCGDPHILK